MAKQDIKVTTAGETLKVTITENKSAGFRIDTTIVSAVVFGLAIYEHQVSNPSWIYGFANGFAWFYLVIVVLGHLGGLYGLNKLDRYRRAHDDFKFEAKLSSESLVRMILPPVLMFLAGFEIRALIIVALTVLYQYVRFSLAARCAK